MITQIRGTLRAVSEDVLTLAIDQFELEVLIPEYTRRRLQGQVDQEVTLHTIFYIEGNAVGGRMNPKLIGFTSPVERDFFETFCSVDGVGVRKALRAMVRPVRELARSIQDQDVKMLATYPGIGEATAERIVAKLRRKVGRFALMVEPEAAGTAQAAGNGEAAAAESTLVNDTFAVLLSVGHTETQARQEIDRVLSGRKSFKTVEDMIEAIYKKQREQE